MAGRKKRKFNWDELSSEEEDAVETKKTTTTVKKVDQKKKANDADDNQTTTRSTRNTKQQSPQIKVEQSPKETVKKEIDTTTTTTTRSTRGTNKRNIDEINNELTEDLKKKTRIEEDESPKTNTKSTTKQAQLHKTTIKEEIKQEIKDEKPKTNKSLNTITIDDSPPKTKAAKLKDERIELDDNFKTPTKNSAANKSTIKKELNNSLTVNNDESTSINILPNKNMFRENGSQPDNDSSQQASDFNLPSINVKSIKMKIVSKQENCKKFNKQHLSPGCLSPTKTKFKEIKIQLNDEQRDWLNKQISKYDGDYDKEFDPDANLFTNSRKRKY